MSAASQFGDSIRLYYVIFGESYMRAASQVGRLDLSI